MEKLVENRGEKVYVKSLHKTTRDTIEFVIVVEYRLHVIPALSAFARSTNSLHNVQVSQGGGGIRTFP